MTMQMQLDICISPPARCANLAQSQEKIQNRWDGDVILWQERYIIRVLPSDRADIPI